MIVSQNLTKHDGTTLDVDDLTGTPATGTPATGTPAIDGTPCRELAWPVGGVSALTGKSAGRFSLGTAQRLGIAGARRDA